MPIDLSSIRKEIEERIPVDIDPLHALVAAAFLSSAATLGINKTYHRYWKRIPNAESVPSRLLQGKRWIKGVVTSVGDADNFRVYHTPGLFWRWPLKLRAIPTTSKDLRDRTIHIRMAAVDAPEAAHFGKPGQPYAAEALGWLRKAVLNKRVWLQVAKRDQYGRIVAMPYMMPRILPECLAKGKCLSMMMLDAGWAQTYDQSGGEFGNLGKAVFQKAEHLSRRKRRGMWASETPLESPADFKKRMKGDATSTPLPPTDRKTPRVSTSGSRRRGWLSFRWRR